VLTPVVTDDGPAVVVNRGWVPLVDDGNDADTDDDPRAAGATPDDDVVVVGRLRPTQQRGSIGPRDPDEGELAVLARVDLARLATQLPYDVAPLYVELEQQVPPQPGELPVPVELPDLDEGPHLSYAGQWFLFSALEVVGWVVLVRKSARRRVAA
jgi:cytochrome oxidase assembly protein ShyY1